MISGAEWCRCWCYRDCIRPYVLVGAGQSKIEVENQESYNGIDAGTKLTVLKIQLVT